VPGSDTISIAINARSQGVDVTLLISDGMRHVSITDGSRYSSGDQDRSDIKSHPIGQSSNIGIGYNGFFGRSKDWLAIVATWAGPTDETLHDQYGLEVDYSFRLTPHSFLTPHVQWINSPSTDDNIWVAVLRARFVF